MAVQRSNSEMNLITTALNVYVIQLDVLAITFVDLMIRMLLKICRNTLAKATRIYKHN
jgi:hypothetical protein